MNCVLKIKKYIYNKKVGVNLFRCKVNHLLTLGHIYVKKLTVFPLEFY